MQLKICLRRREEGLPELAEDIERLTRLAYPNAATAMIELLCIDKFIDAIPEDEIHVKIRQSRPETLRRAMEIMLELELESYQLSSLRQGKPVRAVTVSESHQDVGDVQPPVSQQKPRWVDHLLRCIQQCLQEGSGGGPAKPSPTSARDQRRSRACLKCGKLGHQQRQCPDRTPTGGR